MRTLLLVLCALAALSPAHAGRSNKGTSSAQFLKIGAGARAEAMGGAFGGLADDVEALAYNPAGLGHQRRAQGVFAHEARFAGLRYEFAGAALPLLSWSRSARDKSELGVLGLAVFNLSSGELERRGLVETDTPSGLFSAEDLALALSYGLRPGGGRWAFGATGKLISSRIDAARGSTFAADAGALWRGDRWTFGAGARDMGPGLKLGAEPAPLPSSVFAGASIQATPRLLVAVEAVLPRDAAPGASLGGEYRYVFSAKLVGCARAGWSSTRTDAGALAGASAGLGITVGAADFDFAFQPFGSLGSAFKYSLKLRF